MQKFLNVIVLGAGMSAIALAENLSNSFQVKIYEKSKGVGGRLTAKRYLQTRFHFGAQFCTSNSKAFNEFLKTNKAESFIGSAYDCATGSELNTDNYFIHPDGMQSLVKESAKSLNINFEAKCIKVDEKNNVVTFENGSRVPFDILISSLPLPQSQELLNFDTKEAIVFDPCIAIGLVIDFTKPPKHNAYKSINKDISWAGSSKFFNSKKDETWVAQLSPEASKRMFDDKDNILVKLAHEALEESLGQEIGIQHSSVFKWRYAQCSRSNNNQEFVQLKHNIFAIGDWNISPRIESAFLSGTGLANYLVSNNQ